MICGWLPHDPRADGLAVVRRMAAVLRVHAAQRVALSTADGLTVGLVGGGGAEPAVSSDRRHLLWMAGEAYAGGSFCNVPSVARSRTPAFRRALLDALLRHGIEAVAELDGRYVIVLFDRLANRLTVVNDRFASEPLFWSRTPSGLAFAGGVRGVLMAPGADTGPDIEAIQEAVTFGGFRLGTRTNVRGVDRLAPSTVLEAGRHQSTRRYWRWPSPPPDQEDRPAGELIEHAGALWRQAIRRRLSDAAHPGQTLSGGLDSRAILAEAVGHCPQWTAITYGLDGCDDIRYAGRAAEAAGATWIRHPLYRGDWLEARAAYIQQTDGLIQLSDLMHYEALPLQPETMDVHLSGYIGDAVCGTTFDGIVDAPSLVAKLSYSGLPIAWSHARALGWAEGVLAAGAPSAPRFAVYDHKLLQSIHGIFQGYAPYVRLRTPFIDYALFDFFSARPPTTRCWLYHTWLRRRYPAFFRSIPDQRTGLPAGAPGLAVQLARASRLAARAASRALRRVGVPAPAPRVRAFHDEERHARQPDVRRRLEATILRRDSIVADVFGRAALVDMLNTWFDRRRGPAQAVGALYVFERYHRDLLPTLRAAGRAADALVATQRTLST